MNTSIAKYASNTKTYGMTISLTNRIMIAVGTNNLGHEKYWTSVYASMDLKLEPKQSLFSSHLIIIASTKGSIKNKRKLKRKEVSQVMTK